MYIYMCMYSTYIYTYIYIHFLHIFLLSVSIAQLWTVIVILIIRTLVMKLISNFLVDLKFSFLLRWPFFFPRRVRSEPQISV